MALSSQLPPKKLHPYHLYIIALYYQTEYDNTLFLDVHAGNPSQTEVLMRLTEIQRKYGIYVNGITENHHTIIEITLKP